MEGYPYVFHWGNTTKRAGLKGRRCRRISYNHGVRVELEFENGETWIDSNRAIRRVA